MTTLLRTANQVSAYAYQLHSHKVDSLESLISTVRTLKELNTDFISVYQGAKAKGIWHLSGDDCGTWYELVRPEDKNWSYYAKMFD
jgi:hypothetical protein